MAGECVEVKAADGDSDAELESDITETGFAVAKSAASRGLNDESKRNAAPDKQVCCRCFCCC